MSATTGIEWTDATWNPVRARNRRTGWNPVRACNRRTGKIGWHCTHVSEGCRNCYAEGINRRLGTGLAYKPGHAKDIEIFLDENMLLQPLRWKRPRMIFPGSMTDLFADFVTDAMLDRIFAIMALCPQHTFQVLTKRSARMREYLTDQDLNNRISAALGTMLDGDWIWQEGKRFRDQIEHLIGVFLGEDTDDEGDINRYDDPMPLPNAWLGVSVEDQAAANERIPDLLATPAAIRFVSAEPLLGELTIFDLDGPVDVPDGMPSPLHWIIAGGESGARARPAHPDWFRSLRDQCEAAGVPFLFKQHGEWLPVTSDDVPERFSDPACDQFRCMSNCGFVGGLSIGSASRHKPLSHPACFPAGEDGEAICNPTFLRRVGKKAAGNTLDGRQHLEFPR